MEIIKIEENAFKSNLTITPVSVDYTVVNGDNKSVLEASGTGTITLNDELFNGFFARIMNMDTGDIQLSTTGTLTAFKSTISEGEAVEIYHVGGGNYRAFFFLIPDDTESFSLTNIGTGVGLYKNGSDGELYKLLGSAGNITVELVNEDIVITCPDVVKTNVVNTYTKQQHALHVSLTDAANISWDLDVAQTAKVTLTDDRVLDNPSNMRAGATYILMVKQDATGSRTLNFGNAFLWSGGTAPVLSTDPHAVDLISFFCDGANLFGKEINNFL